MTIKNPVGITDVVLRDAHQSLFATRLRIDDMLPIAAQLDDVGFWSLETWGGATFDACIRFLGEDPWERLRELKQAMPKTPQQMLLRGQNILGYRHYADDIIDKFVERSAINGVDVFRIFDALNDPRNLERAITAVRHQGKHAQGTLSYTVSPVHNIDTWVSMAIRLAQMGVDSIAIKDMAGLLRPYVAFDLVSRLKQAVDLPIHMQCHATSGLSTATCLKAIEAGIDNVDTAISSMSMTYGHSPTESIVAILQGTERDTGLDIEKLEEIAAYFREVRKKYAQFEGTLKGVDSRILVAQVPGGMLTNLEQQLREQNATDRMDEVLVEIPQVRKDLGFIPLVTPTSQIVGTQAVINVLSAERYKNITREVEGLLRGEYGATPAPMNVELQARVLDGDQPITCRPADNLKPEFERLKAELLGLEAEKSLIFGEHFDNDVLTYALFPHIALKFFSNRNNPDAFEPAPDARLPPATHDKPPAGAAVYQVEVEGETFVVKVSEGGDIQALVPSGLLDTFAVTSGEVSGEVSGDTSADASSEQLPSKTTTPADAVAVTAPLGGNIFKLHVRPGDTVVSGGLLVTLEAMKMETNIQAAGDGIVTQVLVAEGDTVNVGDTLVWIS